MRPLHIDFMANSCRGERDTKRIRRILWGVVLILVAAEWVVYSSWQQRGKDMRTQLARQSTALNDGRSPAAGSISSPEASGFQNASRALAAVSAFDPTALAKIEQALVKARGDSPDSRLHIDSLAFDARQRRFVLQGQSLQHQAIDRLRDELLARLPLAVTSFPSLQNNANGKQALQFEIAIRLPALTGSAQ
jgi:hypothetical protein